MQIEAADGEFAGAGGDHVLAALQLNQVAARGEAREGGFQLIAALGFSAQFAHQLFEVGPRVRQLGDVGYDCRVGHHSSNFTCNGWQTSAVSIRLRRERRRLRHLRVLRPPGSGSGRMGSCPHLGCTGVPNEAVSAVALARDLVRRAGRGMPAWASLMGRSKSNSTRATPGAPRNATCRWLNRHGCAPARPPGWKSNSTMAAHGGWGRIRRSRFPTMRGFPPASG